MFSQAKKTHHKWFVFYCLANNLAIARIGVIVAKKNQKKASQRNKLKRLVREKFRRKQLNLKGVDLVVIIKRGVEKVPVGVLRQELCTQMERLAKW